MPLKVKNFSLYRRVFLENPRDLCAQTANRQVFRFTIHRKYRPKNYRFVDNGTLMSRGIAGVSVSPRTRRWTTP